MLDRRDFLKTTVVASMAAAEAAAAADTAASADAQVSLRNRRGCFPDSPRVASRRRARRFTRWSAAVQRFTVVMTDLRGYGDSSKPPDGDNHANYSKRAMALDQVEVMRALDTSAFPWWVTIAAAA